MIHYFGYGSLVNCDTRARDSVAVPGRLSGWVREWRIAGTLGSSGVCALTVTPRKGASIAGVMAREPVAGLAKLDEREQRYERRNLVAGAFRADDGGVLESPGFIYIARAEHYRWGDADHPILQSYVDCVMAGFLRHWGEAGVRDFVETTHGWHVPIVNDRERPIYPRAVTVSQGAREMFDDLLRDAGARLG